jgi:hypothetical protein
MGFAAGTMGIVDFTNYDDMKYAVCFAFFFCGFSSSWHRESACS